MAAAVSFGNHTVTVVRPAPPDWQGDPSGDPTLTEVTGCFMQPRTTVEQDTGMRHTVSGNWVLFMPGGVDIRASDRVRWQGAEYQVNGEPARYPGYLGVEHHIEVDLRKVEG